jgi:AcrR family transcriptional regulator
MEVREKTVNGGVRRRRLTGAQRQRVILDAAAEVFARRGYEGARLEEIASAAGVSKALIYEHFDGKLELYAQIFRRGTDESFGLALSAVAEQEESHARLEAGLGAFLDFVADQPNVWRVVEQEVSDPEIIELDQSRQVRAEKAIAQLLTVDEGIRARELDPAQIDLFAVMINGAMVRAANWWLCNLETPRELVLRSLMEFVWLGMDRIRSGERQHVGV